MWIINFFKKLFSKKELNTDNLKRIEENDNIIKVVNPKPLSENEVKEKQEIINKRLEEIQEEKKNKQSKQKSIKAAVKKVVKPIKKGKSNKSTKKPKK